jgi:RNA polymerase sigma factor (sigma-70 family)
MDAKLVLEASRADEDRSIASVFLRERARLRSFIRRRVSDAADAEDILQEVFYELIEAARLLRPIEQVGAWLFRVARNRITDRFRKARFEQAGGSSAAAIAEGEAQGAEPAFEDWLPAPDAGPEAAYARRLLLEALADALDELPEAQRSVFIAHEVEGLSFRQIAADTGVGLNTLLSRKRYAVLHLRRRLQAIHDEFIDPLKGAER